jgi:RNA polymerase sigma-70 factor (ECF subfamily)
LRQRSARRRALQDIWLSAVRARTDYVANAKFTTWLYRIAHNRLIDHWRATGQVELVRATDDNDNGDDDVLETILARAATSRKSARAHTRSVRGFERRSRRCRPRNAKSFCCTRKAARLGDDRRAHRRPAETVKSRLRYALAKLRAVLGDLQ